MLDIRRVPILLCLLAFSTGLHAQAAKEAAPLWDTQFGASFVGNSGNSDTTTIGGDFAMHRRWPLWQIESTATAIRTADKGVRTAERYVGAFRAQRKRTAVISFSAGERAERDQFAGMNLRSILDAGVAYAIVAHPDWTLDALTALAWNHESPLVGPDRDDPVGVLQMVSRIPFTSTADCTQRFTFYPDLASRRAFRSEAELTAEAAMNRRLALKMGYLWRFSNAPVEGFVKSDHTFTASVVLRWRAATTAP
jgi:putative salt-induced outer membrane protein YdiY